MNPRLLRFLLALSAPVLALVAAFVITSLVLVAAGDPVMDVWKQILSWPERRNMANIINNEDSRGATTGTGGEPTLGKETGRAATLSQSEIGALVAAIRSCITLPAGAEDADARAEFTFTIGADGMVVGQPQMNSQPSSQIEDAYARAVSRALQRCGPFSMAAGQDVRAQFAAREF